MKTFSAQIAIVVLFSFGGIVDAADEIMTVDQIKPGMIGIGKTVFKGTEISEFKAEILGVMKNFEPKKDMILARLSGGPLDITRNVIAGMSGSPVYVDGKMIGADANGWWYAKQAICGITPIVEMIEVFSRGLEDTGSSSIHDDRRESQRGRIDLADNTALSSLLKGASLEPIATPLVMSGFSKKTIELVSGRLEALGFIPMQGGGNADAMIGDAPFIPGAAIGVQLLGGDISMTGIGTLTYRDGDRVIAFGHSMFSGGTSDLPMTNAYIYDVMPSTQRSFKLGAPGKPIGAIRQDRFPAIAGIIGQIPDMIPMAVKTASDHREDRYHFEVLRHREIGPILTWIALLETIVSAEKEMGDATIHLESKMKIKGYPEIRRENVYSGSEAFFETTVGAVTPLFTLANNQFERSKVESIDFDVTVEERQRSARIDEIAVDRTVVRPGDEITGRILLPPFQGEQEEVQSTVQIPEGVPDGQLLLYVGSESSAQALEMSRAPGKFIPRDTAHLLEILGMEEQNDRLVVELFSQDQGLTVEGKELPDLPASSLAVLGRSKRLGQTGPVIADILLKERIQTRYVLKGSQAVRITVDRNAK
jgi:hypothetical protein